MVELADRGTDLFGTSVLLPVRDADFLHQFGGLTDVRHDGADQLSGLLGDADARSGDVVDLGGGILTALGQLPNLGRHHGEALAMLPGTCRLDGRVQGEQVGLSGDLLDDQDLVGDVAHGPNRLVDRLAALLSVAGRLRRNLLCLSGVRGILPDGRRHLLDGTGHLLGRRCLLGGRVAHLLGAVADLLTARGHLLRRRLDLADHFGQLGDHHLQGLHQFVAVGALLEIHGQVAHREFPGHLGYPAHGCRHLRHGSCQLPHFVSTVRLDGEGEVAFADGLGNPHLSFQGLEDDALEAEIDHQAQHDDADHGKYDDALHDGGRCLGICPAGIVDDPGHAMLKLSDRRADRILPESHLHHADLLLFAVGAVYDRLAHDPVGLCVPGFGGQGALVRAVEDDVGDILVVAGVVGDLSEGFIVVVEDETDGRLRHEIGEQTPFLIQAATQEVLFGGLLLLQQTDEILGLSLLEVAGRHNHPRGHDGQQRDGHDRDDRQEFAGDAHGPHIATSRRPPRMRRERPCRGRRSWNSRYLRGGTEASAPACRRHR